MGLYKETNTFTQEDKRVCLIGCIWCVLYVRSYVAHTCTPHSGLTHYYICIIPGSLSLFLSMSTAAKKNLAPSAVAGLAAKLDLSTVKLRKTGNIEQIIAQQKEQPSQISSCEHDTSHSVMLLQVKGQLLLRTKVH